MRCDICNYLENTSGSCLEDPGDLRPRKSQVKYYKDLDQCLCGYCLKIINKHRRFYEFYYSNKSEVDVERPKQENKKTTPKVPEMSE